MSKSDVSILMEKVTEQEVRELDKELPSDVHLIEYVQGQDLILDAVRAYSMVDIFDTYHDWLNAKVLEGEITSFEIRSIKSGFGVIKPKLWKGL